MKMKVILGVSNRHVHLTEEIYRKLFGDETLNVVKKLRQPGQFASDKFVTIKNGDREIKHVRVLGPLRKYNQVEISRTDSYTLKVKPPVRDSGNIEGSSPITLLNGENRVDLKEGCIIANRHIHISPKELKEYGLENVKKVKIKIEGEKGGILDNVMIRVDENFKYELHLDTDDGNAFNVKTGDEIEIIEMERR
ncbi:MAG: phosphate propanoyltransferase [Bacilli bacterium]|nr:phosphate propanoyltransferase [Bacilli bacterium]